MSERYNVIIVGTGVGGATKLYGAALYRLRPQDFGAVQHADGVSPAWPLSYDDFEPWYTRAEWLYQVRGIHGEDPTEGHWSKDYPWPPVSHEPRIEAISGALTAGGYHPFHAPCGILLDEADRPRSACIRCATCDGYPCLVHAKADADIIAVRPLLDQPNVTLLVNAEVERLETDPSGRTVSRVQVSRDGNQEFYEADIVVLSAGAANSAKILLRSASDRHPAGDGDEGRGTQAHHASRSPEWLTRRAPAASGRIRPPQCSTSTARPTRSTTCTSSTRASSRASAP